MELSRNRLLLALATLLLIVSCVAGGRVSLFEEDNGPVDHGSFQYVPRWKETNRLVPSGPDPHQPPVVAVSGSRDKNVEGFLGDQDLIPRWKETKRLVPSGPDPRQSPYTPPVVGFPVDDPQKTSASIVNGLE